MEAALTRAARPDPSAGEPSPETSAVGSSGSTPRPHRRYALEGESWNVLPARHAYPPGSARSVPTPPARSRPHRATTSTDPLRRPDPQRRRPDTDHPRPRSRAQPPLRTDPPNHGHPSRGTHHPGVGIDRRDRGRPPPDGAALAGPPPAPPRPGTVLAEPVRRRVRTADPGPDAVGPGRRRRRVRGARRRRTRSDAGAHARPADDADHRVGLPRLRPRPRRGRGGVGLGASAGIRSGTPRASDAPARAPGERTVRDLPPGCRPHGARSGRRDDRGGRGRDADLVARGTQRANQAAYASNENGRPRKSATRSAALPAPPGTSTRSR